MRLKTEILLIITLTLWSVSAAATDYELNPAADAACDARLNCTVDGNTWRGGVSPGDSINILAGRWGHFTFRHLKGARDRRIRIRNKPHGAGNRVVFDETKSQDNTVVRIIDCLFVDFTGDGATGQNYGFEIDMTQASANKDRGLLLQNRCSHIRISQWKVIGNFPRNMTGRGIGQQNGRLENSDCLYPVCTGKKWTLNDVEIDHCWVSRVGAEALYLGSNKAVSRNKPYIANFSVHDNLIEKTGRGGINIKSAWIGTTNVYDNVIRHTNLEHHKTFRAALAIKDNIGDVNVFRNLIYESEGIGMVINASEMPPGQDQAQSLGRLNIYNNLIIRPGCYAGYGAARRSAIRLVYAKHGARAVYNNTIVSPPGFGFSTGCKNCSLAASDNIITDWGLAAFEDTSKWLDVNNLKKKKISDCGFVDAAGDNYRLKKDSPAVDKAVGSVLREDFDRKQRPWPKGGANDQGAFEYHR